MDLFWRVYRPFRTLSIELEAHKYLKNFYWELFDLATPAYIEKSAGGVGIEYRLNEPRQLRNHTANPLEFPDFTEEIKPNDVFFDVGAHRGLYTCFAAAASPKLDIVAIEPGPAIDILQKNISENGFQNIRTEQIALGEEPGSLSVPDTTSGMMVNLSDKQRGSKSIPVIPGDKFVSARSVELPTVLKIDVEGAEGAVIRGFEDTIRNQTCRLVFLEVHHPNNEGMSSTEKYGDTPDDVLELLERMGFKNQKVGQRGPQSHYKCIRKENNE
jgi:FkbM family methyltransferase